MEQIVMEGVTPFLSREIIKNILKRLPVKSLVRFQCVSKDWKNLIKSTSFIEDHLLHSSNQIPSLLLQQNYKKDPLCLYMIDGQMRIFEVQNPPLMGSLLGAQVIGSSNGLVCVEIDRYGVSSPSLLLWNPSIREVRPLSVTMYGSDGDCALGFGFCPIVNDYKIVRTYAEYEDEVSRVEVYSWSKGSWKEIEFENLEGISLFSENVSLNGAIFFFGVQLDVEEEGGEMTELLVSFDIATEVFNAMPWPTVDCNSDRKLTVHDNKLAMICLNVIGIFESSFVDLWVMEEGTGASGERWTWTKKYTSKTRPFCLSPMTMWRNDFICKADVTESKKENGKPKAFICMFNVSTNESRSLTLSNVSGITSIFNYVESLVPVGNIHIEEPRSLSKKKKKKNKKKKKKKEPRS